MPSPAATAATAAPLPPEDCGTNTLSIKFTRPDHAPYTGGASLDEDYAELRSRCERFGYIRSAVLFKSHRRATIIFDDNEQAAMAHRLLAGLRLPSNTVIQVQPGKPTPLAPRRPNLLEVPVLHRNLFLSPPPSPPDGWEPSLEAKPEPDWAAHAAALDAQLRQYEVFAGTDELPSIVVEDMDFDASKNAGLDGDLSDVDPESMPHKVFERTRRPPLRTTSR